MIDIIILGAIVVGIVQVFKNSFNIPARFIPLLTMILTFGIIALNLYIENLPITWEVLQNGFIVGLSALGLWSGTKATIGK